jgi:aspartyl-tRNA(Asn)/glutamyl-tRNA(Gln) amidotransferase subunit B
MRSPLEAKTYLTELKLLLSYLGVSDCNMQEGSLRVDANVNLHVRTPQGTAPTPIVEVKNMNSFRAVERALAFEAQRQHEVWLQTGQRLGDVPKQTRGWDDVANVTRGQRHKEESSDYRYFPEPDLVPVTTTPQQVEAVRAGLGELPAALRRRLERDYGLTPYDSDVLVSEGQAMVDYFLEVARLCGDGKLAANWVQNSVLSLVNARGGSIEEFPLRPDRLAGLLRHVAAGDLDQGRGREILEEMLAGGQTADQIMASRGIVRVDESAVIELCLQAIEANPRIVADVKGGRLQAAGALVGFVKKRNANVNPKRVQEICLELIGKL